LSPDLYPEVSSPSTNSVEKAGRGGCSLSSPQGFS
jgi:hypothetical protein